MQPFHARNCRNRQGKSKSRSRIIGKLRNHDVASAKRNVDVRQCFKPRSHVTRDQAQPTLNYDQPGESSSSLSAASIHHSVLSLLGPSKLFWPFVHLSEDKSGDQQVQDRICLASEVARALPQSQFSDMHLHAAVQHRAQLISPVLSTTTNYSSNVQFPKDMALGFESVFATTQGHEYDRDTGTNASLIAHDINLALAMNKVRKKQKLVAAHRVEGIIAAARSDDPEVIQIRLDICLDGDYVACYHAYFDLVVMDDDDKNTTLGGHDSHGNQNNSRGEGRPSSGVSREGANKVARESTGEKLKSNLSRKKSESRLWNGSSPDRAGQPGHHAIQQNPSLCLYLRLAQHTIPPSIPLTEITERTLGGSRIPLQSLQEKNSGPAVGLKYRLSSWCWQCYRACCSWERRLQAWSFLESYQRTKIRGAHAEESSKVLLLVNSLATNASGSLDRISFHLTTEGPKKVSAKVQLLYQDWASELPTTVQVRVLHQLIGPSIREPNGARTTGNQPRGGVLERSIKTAEFIKGAFEENHPQEAVKIIQYEWHDNLGD